MCNSVTYPVPLGALDDSLPPAHSAGGLDWVSQDARAVVSNSPRVTRLQTTWSNLVPGPATALLPAFIHHLSGSDLETCRDKHKVFIISSLRLAKFPVKVAGDPSQLLVKRWNKNPMCLRLLWRYWTILRNSWNTSQSRMSWNIVFTFHGAIKVGVTWLGLTGGPLAPLRQITRFGARYTASEMGTL